MKEIKKAVLLFTALTILTGVFYPAAVTVLAQIMFPKQASGSLVYMAEGKPAGSELIGQPFYGPEYFWPRPSATAEFPYNPLASGGSNMGPTNKDLVDKISDRVKTLRASGVQGDIPADLIMASGSGLDPHISVDAAFVQAARIARERNMSEEKVRGLVKSCTEGRQFGFLGRPRVNVLKLNLLLDRT